MKIYALLKTAIKKWKGRPQTGKISAKPVSDKGSVSIIYKFSIS